jgi:penicillin-binding protein 2
VLGERSEGFLVSGKDKKDDLFNFNSRLRAVQYLMLALFVALGIRFSALQVVHYQAYLTRADNNRVREVPIIAARGAILDRSGNTLVDNKPAFNIVVTPELVENRDNTRRVLIEHLAVDRDQASAAVEETKRERSQPILVKQNATETDRAWVAAHEYEHPEIVVEAQPQRHYPHGSLAAHVLGYIGEISPKQLEDPRYIAAGYKPGDIVGQGGIEKVYDKILRGSDGLRLMLVDSRGRPIRELNRIEPVKGQDIVTTLDLEVQTVAERQFDDKRETGVAVALDPRDGEVLAMVSKPAFDPNAFAAHLVSSKNLDQIRHILNDPEALFNKAIRGIYPTGSTWKIMMATAALEEGVISLKNSRIPCGGGIGIGNRFVHCMGSHGDPDIHAAIVHSCDGYFYRLGLKMGIDMIHDWIVRFGMGQRTGIDLPHEEAGIIPDPAWKRRARPRDPEWKDFDTVLAAVGQGSVAVPPIQLLRAEAGIMMNGEYHTPHVLKEAKGNQVAPARSYEDDAAFLKLARLTVDTVSHAVWGVVNEGGTGSVAALPGIDIGGKTGTAQVIAKEKARGKQLQDQSWFISFAPLHTGEKPELAVVVVTEHGGQGGKASAPKARMINAAYFSKKLGRQLLPEVLARTVGQQPTRRASVGTVAEEKNPTHLAMVH